MVSELIDSTATSTRLSLSASCDDGVFCDIQEVHDLSEHAEQGIDTSVNLLIPRPPTVSSGERCLLSHIVSHNNVYRL